MIEANSSFAGGILGFAPLASITNTANFNKVIASSYSGGIAGSILAGSLGINTNLGEVASYHEYAGGMIGRAGNTLAMNYVHELDEKKFTHALWEMCTECIVVFPDGVGVLPWMLCGTNEIGRATAKKMEEFRLVVWGMHGIYGAGKTLDETFGLIETVEKAAQIYMLTAHLPRVNTIKDEQMQELAEFFGVNYREDFLNVQHEQK